MHLTPQAPALPRSRPVFALALITFAMLAFALGLAGCGESGGGTPAPEAGGEGGDAPAASAQKPVVVATTTMIADLARTLGGDAVTVIGIVKAGEDPHVYEVRPNDARDIADADLVLVNGMNLEATLDRVIDNNAKGTVVRLAESVEFSPIGSDDPDKPGGAADPHVWMDPTIWDDIAQVAGDALLAVVSEDEKAGVTQRTADYIAELGTLDAEIKQAFTSVPEAQRVIVTSHDAFAYFGRAYGLEVHGVIGITTEQQPRPQDVKALEDLVRDRGVRAVFIETSTAGTLNQIVEKVADATGAAVGGTLFSDSLGEPGTPGGTYLGMMRHNATTVTEALKQNVE